MTTFFSRRTALASLVLGLGFASLATPLLAQSRTGGSPNSMYAGIGLKGYDPVAYFTDGRPVKGLESISATNAGLTWHFASAAHKAAFEKEPAKYLPQYGGFCSWGVAQGKLFDVDPVRQFQRRYSEAVQGRADRACGKG
jgi:YHS domain-containing protein